MFRVSILFLLCAVLALSGCGNSGRGAADSGSPEPAVVQIETPASSGPAPTQPPSDTAGVTYTPVDGAAKAVDEGARVTISGGSMEIVIDGCVLERDVALDSDASVRLILQNGGTFTGAVQGGSMQDVYIELDESSVWTLTGDVAVEGIVNADATFANIQSAGFSIEYNSESEDNAYLAGAAKQLPGGGFLTPII